MEALEWWLQSCCWPLSPMVVVWAGIGVGLCFGLLVVAVAVFGFSPSVSNLHLPWSPHRLPLPPGPPGEFFFGHYRMVPFEAPFMQYAEWGREYGSDVLFFSAFGKKWIVLNSLKAATDLLDKRGHKYSDRPRFVMWELMGWAPTLTWLRWGTKMQQHRRALQPPFCRSRVGEYRDAQGREAVRAVASMASRPGAWMRAVRRFAAGVVLDVAYGIELSGDQDPFVRIADEAAAAVGNAGAPAGSIVDRWPLTRYLPSWLPFMERLRYAERCKPAILTMTNAPFAVALRDATEKVMKKCFVREQLEVYEANESLGIPNDLTLDDIKGAAATIFIAGSDTTASTVQLFILYMMQNPQVQAKAQREIDAVIGHGPDRLPSWDDLAELQYLYLILQECYRSNPLSPLGIPHASLEDDEYEGMFIPRGTVVYQNVWAMTHDPTVYSKPHTFRPERYLSREQGGWGEPFPTGNFGFGRRVCVGRHLAENSLLIIFATILASLHVGPPLGPGGLPRYEEVKWSFRGQAYPLPFKCSLTPRSERALELLAEADRASASS